MKKVLQQICSIFLAVLIAFTVFANPAWAEENSGEPTTTPEVVDPTETLGNTTNQTVEESTVDSWYFDGDVFVDNNGTWEINPSVNAENPLTKEALQEILPSNVILVISGNETYLPITWNLDTYGESQYEGEFTIYANITDTTQVPSNFSTQLEAKVVFDNPTSVAIEQSVLENHTVKNTVSPYGTTINLFDYWTKDKVPTSGDYMAGDADNSGINSGSLLKFSLASKKTESYNNWTGSDKPLSIVEDNLYKGYPILKNTLSNTSTLGQDSRSLSYLFDSTTHDGKEAYTDVKGLLQTDENGYYYYDSEKNFAEFNEKSNSFTLYDKPAVYSNTGTLQGQFFPFNTADEVFNQVGNDIQKKYIKSTGNSSTDANRYVLGAKLNHYFGVSMSTRFIQQHDGYTSESKTTPVIYEFSGDDDVWVYIDDVLVADLGGIHNKASLKIDFTNGKIYINNVEQDSTLKQTFEKAGKSGIAFNGDTFANNTYHTLNFFYLERGNVDSNMYLKFNLVTVPESDISKIDQLGNSIPGATFALYESDKDYKIINKENPLATGTTQSDGTFVLVDSEGYIVSLNDLYTQGITNVVLSETVVPSGYRKVGDDMHLKIATAQSENGSNVNTGAFLVCENVYESGAFATAKVRTTLTETITSYDGSKTFDYKNGGTVFAVVMKYVGTDGDRTNPQNWRPVTGDEVNGWDVAKNYSMDEIINSAKTQPHTFTVSSSGAYQTDIDGLPGDIRNYYYINDTNTTDVKFSVGYFYTSANDLSNAVSANTVRLKEDDFVREFAARLYVPNVGNYLLIQKTDSEGNVISATDDTTKAEFAIYNDTQVENGELKANAKPIAIKSTENMSKENGGFLNMDGVAGFPTVTVNDGTVVMNFNLTNGTYYIKETKAPSGYLASDDLIKVVVNDEGVFPDAGTEDDDISVMLGVGSVVKSLYQSTNGTADSTLRDITVTLQNSTDLTNWKNVNVSNTTNPISANLSYNKDESILEYAQVKTDRLSNYPNDFVVNSGYARLNVKQWNSDESDKTDLSKMDNLNHLFASTVVVRVANHKSELTISKSVANIENTTELSTNRDFTFNIKLNNSDDTPITGDVNYILTSYNDATLSINSSDPTIDTNTLTLDENGTGTINLKRNQVITLQNLPVGAKYTITEIFSDDVDGKYTTYYSLDESSLIKGNAVTNQLVSDDSDSTIEDIVDFTNVYNFEFTKINSSSTGLQGATFNLYRLTCIDKSHDHSSELVDIKKYPKCWEKDTNVYESKENGIVTLNNLIPNNEYRLVETKAPNGYVLPNGEWRLTYDESINSYVFTENCGVNNPPAIKIVKETLSYGRSVNTYKVINAEVQELPLTGYNGIKFYLICGMILMLVGGASMILIHKRRVM